MEKRSKDLIDHILELVLSSEDSISFFNYLIKSPKYLEETLLLILKTPSLVPFLDVKKQIELCTLNGAKEFVNLLWSKEKTFNPVFVEEILNSKNISKNAKWEVLSKLENVLDFSPELLIDIIKSKNFPVDETSKIIINALSDIDFNPECGKLIELKAMIPTEFKIQLLNHAKFKEYEMDNLLTVKSIEIFAGFLDKNLFSHIIQKWEIEEIVEECCKNISNSNSLKVLSEIVATAETTEETVQKIFDLLVEQKTLTSKKTFPPLKSSYANLLLKIADHQKMRTIDLCRLILCAYGCTLSSSDLILLKAFKEVSNDTDVSYLQPFVFSSTVWD